VTQPNDSFASNSGLTQSRRGQWSYFALFGMQTIGAVVLFWTGLLLYRQALADPSHSVRPPAPQSQNALLGHGILFLARMIYVLPTAIFGFVFVAQRPEFEIPIFRCLVLLLGLFSLFCYVRELERLGRGFTG
jgi:hypothetical protein